MQNIKGGRGGDVTSYIYKIVASCPGNCDSELMSGG